MILQSPQIKHIHCIGIGGIGVSGLAEILLRRGYQVSGSDANCSKITERLEKLGIVISYQHTAEQVDQADLVVYSSAIHQDNPELKSALQKQKICIKRGELLAELMQLFPHSVAMAGTHGKTTTTSLLSHLLIEAQYDPTCVIGGIINGYSSPIHIGDSPYCVAEADESDASFLHMHPEIAIVNNIEADHLETYQGDFAKLCESFASFLAGLPPEGLAVLCHDDKVVMQLAANVCAKKITYGFSKEADLYASDFSQKGLQSSFVLHWGEIEHAVVLNLIGRHNVSNALAVIAVAVTWGIDFPTILRGLASFPGVGRRFQPHAPLRLSFGLVPVYEDYGHHPSEIRVTLKAAQEAWPNQRIVLVFQPHRYSRTRDLMNEFVEVLSCVDQLVLTDIYPASEAPISGVSSEVLAEAIFQCSGKRPMLIPNIHDLAKQLPLILEKNDVVLFQGAGNIGGVAASIGTE